MAGLVGAALESVGIFNIFDNGAGSSDFRDQFRLFDSGARSPESTGIFSHCENGAAPIARADAFFASSQES